MSSGAQRAYFMLISQPRIDAAGVQTTSMRRWAGLSTDGLAALQEAMRELVSNQFVLVDTDTEECLVRTFVKWDNHGYANRLRRRAIEKAYLACASKTLKASILGGLEALGYGFAGPLDRVSNTPSQALSIAPEIPPDNGYSDGEHRNQEPGTRNLEPTTSLEPSVREVLKPIIDEAFGRFWSIYPKRAGKLAAYRRFDQMVRTKVDPEEIIEGARAYATECVGKDRSFIKNPEGWLHAGRWEDDRMPAAVGAGSTAALDRESRRMATDAFR